jgi:hypothetical protein
MQFLLRDLSLVVDGLMHLVYLCLVRVRLIPPDFKFVH